MRQRKTFYFSVGGRLIALATVALFAATFISYQQFLSLRVVEAQARRQSPKARPKPNLRARSPLTAASFKHEHHRLPTAKLSCSDCHTIAEKTAPDVIAAATKTSIRGYPYHDSCTDCHRRTPPQFFRGTTPSICTVCHTRSSPRLTARDMSPFPKQNEQARDLQFPGYYPHDQSDHKRVNCATCHMTDERPYFAIPVGSAETPYKPAEGTFKTSPSGHAACFKCHWQDEKPTKDNCAGCHLTPDEIAKKPRNVLSANAREWFKSWPREWPKRLSLKFNHESKDHDDECTTCHDLARIKTLDIVKAEVGIATCATSKCHLRSAKPSIEKEIWEEEADIAEEKSNDPASREGKHACTGCHTTPIGSLPPPCTHLLLFADRAEDYPSAAKQFSEQCKK